MMRKRLTSRTATGLAIGAVVLSATSTFGQAPAARGAKPPAARKWTLPRTPDGHPDLQGIWNNSTTTPLQRPDALADKVVLTEEETAALNQQVDRGGLPGSGTYRNTDLPPDAGDPGTYNEFWWERGKSIGRTSLIIDPPDGRLPLTPDGRKRVEARAEAIRRHPADSWEDRSLQERCIIYHGIPPLPTGYNNNYTIVQTKDHVAILHEMIHEVRIIPLDGRPHLGQGIRLWMGDSRGRWEGDTLVVETTNFTDKLLSLSGIGIFGTGTPTMRVVERFTRVDADTIDYRFTVEDPGTFTKPFTALLPMRKTEGPLYEYACHEGNYGLMGILSGARAQEKAREKKGEGARQDQ